ncbi:MAG: tyrosine-type recombinase/integrase [Clostridia bacterium]
MEYLLKDWMEQWLEFYCKNNVKLKTYIRYKEIIRDHVAESELGNTTLNGLDSFQVQKFIFELLKNGNIINRKPLAANTINLIVTVIKNAIARAEDAGIIDSNACMKIQRPKRTEKEVKAFTVKEQRRIVEVITLRNKIADIGIMICLYIGIRLGEVLSLRWENVDLRNKTLTINSTVARIKLENGKYENYYTTAPKTHHSNRTIPLPENIVILLKITKKSSKSKFVVSNEDGTSITTRGYQSRLKTIEKIANVSNLSFHSLRHTFATRALESGMDIKTLSEILGHKSPGVTLDRYVHSMEETKRKMINRACRVTTN